MGKAPFRGFRGQKLEKKLHALFGAMAIFLFLIIGFCPSLSAQVLTIDRAAQDTTIPKVFNLSGSLNIDMDEQKANIFDEDGSLETSWQKPKNALLFHGTSEIVTGGPNNSLLNTRSLQLRDRVYPKKRFHPEFYTQYQYDAINGLQNRMLAGGNLRFIIKDKGTFRAFAATGLMYEYEDWNYRGVLYVQDVPPNPHDTIRKALKSTSYIRLSKFFGSKVDFSLVVFYQAQPDLFFKFPRIAEFAQLNFNLSEHFSLNLQFDSQYDTRPVVPIKKFYFSFNQGLTFKL